MGFILDTLAQLTGAYGSKEQGKKQLNELNNPTSPMFDPDMYDHIKNMSNEDRKWEYISGMESGFDN